jgi:hypothetical protein
MARRHYTKVPPIRSYVEPSASDIVGWIWGAAGRDSGDRQACRLTAVRRTGAVMP